jgi:hypothetical protein
MILTELPDTRQQKVVELKCKINCGIGLKTAAKPEGLRNEVCCPKRNLRKRPGTRQQKEVKLKY